MLATDTRIVRKSDELVDCLRKQAEAEAREKFYGFRRYMHPDRVHGQFLIDVSVKLQAFVKDLQQGKRPKLLLLSPPQHGKSSAVIDLAAWVAGIDPSLKMVFTSYADDLGVRANLGIQRILDSERYIGTFGKRLPPTGRTAVDGLRNTSVLEFPGHIGSFRNTTVQGPITGQALDLGFVDDPIKGRAEAQSQLIRDKTWAWLLDDFFTRFSDHAGLIFITTRWHVDDPAGRFLDRFPDTTVLTYKALADEDEKHLKRKAGEPLFPEFKSLDFLLERKQVLTQGSWLSLYQQSPIVIGGGIFPIDKLAILDAMPSKDQIKASVRAWDFAASEGEGDWTVGLKMHSLRDGRFLVEDLRRDQWSAMDRNRIVLQTAKLDGAYVPIVLEQEPGSSGKEVAEGMVRALAGYRVTADKVTGDKALRADPFAAQVQAGNVLLLNRPWVRDYLNELEQFPAGTHDDMVDASSSAFSYLTIGKKYDATGAWIGLPRPQHPQGIVSLQ